MKPSPSAVFALLICLSVAPAARADAPAQGPKVLPFQEGRPIPEGYRRRWQPHLGLVITGGVMFTAGYTPVASATLATDILALGLPVDTARVKAMNALLVPVVGPFWAISTMHTGQAGTTWLVVDGVAQGIGAVLFATGMAWSDTVLVRDGVAIRAVVPVASATMSGLTLAGTF